MNAGLLESSNVLQNTKSLRKEVQIHVFKCLHEPFLHDNVNRLFVRLMDVSMSFPPVDISGGDVSWHEDIHKLAHMHTRICEHGCSGRQQREIFVNKQIESNRQSAAF